jgi:hypothetical protein
MEQARKPRRRASSPKRGATTIAARPSATKLIEASRVCTAAAGERGPAQPGSHEETASPSTHAPASATRTGPRRESRPMPRWSPSAKAISNALRAGLDRAPSSGPTADPCRRAARIGSGRPAGHCRAGAPFASGSRPRCVSALVLAESGATVYETGRAPGAGAGDDDVDRRDDATLQT